MAKETRYFAIFKPEKGGTYNVSFPDFPGCVTFGRTFEEAKRKAREVLELWLEEISERTHTVPVLPEERPIVDEITVALPA